METTRRSRQEVKRDMLNDLWDVKYALGTLTNAMRYGHFHEFNLDNREQLKTIIDQIYKTQEDLNHVYGLIKDLQ